MCGQRRLLRWNLVAWSFLGIFLFAAMKTEGAVKIGVFPVRTAPDLESSLASDEFLANLTEALIRDLQEANLGEVIPLALPAGVEHDERLNFETFVGRGREAGCTGVLVLTLAAVNFSVEGTAVAEIRLKGGLVDVPTAAGVAPVTGAGALNQRNYQGPSPDDIGEVEAFDRSLLGRVTADARKQIVTAIRAGLPRLTATSTPLPPRKGAPEGLSFSQDSYEMQVVPGGDRRGFVAIVNRGEEPGAFIIKPLDAAEGAVVGLKGEGSMDGASTLGPGQWKYVRVVVFAPSITEEQTVRLGLYIASEDAATDAGQPHDTAAFLLKPAPDTSASGLKLAILSQDPGTLAYTGRITNGSRENWLEIAPDESQATLVRTFPDLSHSLHLAPGETLNFSVIPRFPLGVRSMDVALLGPGGPWPFHFEMPAGKRLFFGLSGTTESSSSAEEECTNSRCILATVDPEFAGAVDPICVPEDEMSASWAERLQRQQGPESGERITGRDARVSAMDEGPPPYEGPPPQTPREGTVRASVRARLPGLVEDSTAQPGLAFTKDWHGMTASVPDANAISVYFAASSADSRTLRQPVRLNDVGHTARWPYLAAELASSRAFVAWEDTTGDKTAAEKSDVAFRASGPNMDGWMPIVYLTRHASGVEDPIVLVAPRDRVAVAWVDRRSGTGQIYVRISADGGKSFAPEVAMPRAADEAQAWPQGAVMPDGELALTYVAATGSDSAVVTRLLHATGTFTDAWRVSHAGAPAGEPQVASDSQGRRFAVWREGEGAASEIWFATSGGNAGPWSAPRQITRDLAYSEYPQVRASEDGMQVDVVYHSDVSGVADLVYSTRSLDGGATWDVPKLALSFDPAVERAWIEVTFKLEWPRRDYAPEGSTYVFFNGRPVAALERMVPEGTFVFEVPARLVRGTGTGLRGNSVMVKSDGKLNQADHIFASGFRLIAKRTYSQVEVFAATQAEADALASRSGASLNHNRPDLVVGANAMPHLPQHLEAGEEINLPLQVWNLGEMRATGVKVTLYAEQTLGNARADQNARLAEQVIGDLQPGTSRDIRLAFKFDRQTTPRVYVKVESKEADFFPNDNLWGLSFTTGASEAPSPLLGTDIPNVVYTPDLLQIVRVPNVDALQDLLARPDFARLTSVNGWPLPKPSEMIDDAKSRLKNLIKRLPES